MKKILTFALMAMIALSASAAKKKAPAKDQNKPVFTTIKEIPVTSMKRHAPIWSSLVPIVYAWGASWKRVSL